jgi:multiple sugar transport system ATP-binding protein
MRPQLIISLDPASQVREGEQAEFWVDVSRMHLFDPHTGNALSTASRSTAGAS